MKSIILTAALLVMLSACACPPEIAVGIDQVGATQDILLPQYLTYVKADAKLDAAQKDDRIKLVESLNRLIVSLKKAAKGD